MVYSYDLARDLLTPEQLTQLDSKLQSWQEMNPEAKWIIEALKLERFLSATAMGEILTDLINTPLHENPGLTEFEKEYEKICGKHLLQGGGISTITATLLGNAVDKETFINRLLKLYGEFFSKDRTEAAQFVESLIAKDEFDPACQTFYLSNRNMWATWDEREGQHPFAFRQTESPYEVRLCLALAKPKPENSSLLLLVYTLDREIVLHKPTIADALGYKYFRPPLDGQDEHGMTYSNHPDLEFYREHLEGHSHYNSSPRPEGIHQSVKIKSLVMTEIRELFYGDQWRRKS